MNKLNETKVLTNVHLSDSQKLVMVKIKASANANVAGEQSRNSDNMASAQRTLEKLGLITIDASSGASLTDKGITIMAAENLTDDTGALTPEGQKFADAKGLADLAKVDNGQTGKEPPAPDVDGDGVGDAPLGESLSLFKDIHAMAKLTEL